jgi:hypothetical protein
MTRPRKPSDAWPADHERPRVLVEHADGAVRAVSERVLIEEGFDVTTCGGPESLRRGVCPLAAGNECELAEGADVIYTGLDWSERSSRDVLRALRNRFPRKSIVIEVRRADAAMPEHLAKRCRVTTAPSGRASLIASVRRALENFPR